MPLRSGKVMLSFPSTLLWAYPTSPIPADTSHTALYSQHCGCHPQYGRSPKFTGNLFVSTPSVKPRQPCMVLPIVASHTVTGFTSSQMLANCVFNLTRLISSLALRLTYCSKELQYNPRRVYCLFHFLPER